MPAAALMQEELYTALKMTRTSMVWEPRFETDFANGYEEYGRSLGPDRRNSPATVEHQRIRELATEPKDYETTGCSRRNWWVGYHTEHGCGMERCSTVLLWDYQSGNRQSGSIWNARSPRRGPRSLSLVGKRAHTGYVNETRCADWLSLEFGKARHDLG
jgi:CubicO group peptidase (beta-lactamase class C family)